MRKKFADNKGSAEFSLITAIVLTGVADLLLLTAICKGFFESGEVGKRGCYAQVQEMLAQEQEEEQQLVTKDPDLAGTGWTSPEGEYFFAPEGDGFYYMNDKTENYIRGSAVVNYIKKEELYGTEGEVVLMSSDSAQYFRIDVLVQDELYFGSRKGGYNYVLYLSRDGSDAYIYDSGWGESTSAQIVDYPLQALLDDHFDRVAQEADVWWPDGDPSIFAVQDVDFNIVENLKEVWNAVEINGRVVFKRDNGLYITDLNSIKEPELLYKPDDGRSITVFGTDGKDLLFGLGQVYSSGYETDELLRMDIGSRSVSSLIQDRVQDFCVADGSIYYTDYERLMRLDASGRTTTLWDYTVYSYEVADGMVFLYDGDTWELLDAQTGEDYGYITGGNNFAYECDICKHTEDYLYFVAYDYNRESISLHSLNIWTGDERVVGDEFAGKMSDTYNVVFMDTFCYFTAENSEKLVRVDVSTGETESRDLADAGWWYATELMNLCGETVMHAVDPDGGEVYLSIGGELQMTELPALQTGATGDQP